MLEPTAEEMAAATLRAAELEAKIFKDAYKKEYAEHLHESRYGCHQRDTVRSLRRKIRHLRSLLKTKDRLLASQKSFYEEMLNEKDKVAKADGKDIEKWFGEMLIRAIRNLDTATAAPQP